MLSSYYTIVYVSKTVSDSVYRFSFNGKESDNEVKGTGNSIDFGERMYDPRIGRWMSLDPLSANYPSITPYASFNNNPIIYIDPDGKKWINAYDSKVKELQTALITTPNNKRTQRELKRALVDQEKVNQIIITLRENDEQLYNYIENLIVVDAKTNETINVNVTVSLDYPSGKQNHEEGSTNYRRENSQGEKKYVIYDGLEGEYKFTPAPMNKKDEVGFDIILFTTADYADIILSNEAGDVMYRMEYPGASYKSGTDTGKSREAYTKKGSAGDYSFKVEDTYKGRRKEKLKSGKKSDTNPYPLKNEK